MRAKASEAVIGVGREVAAEPGAGAKTRLRKWATALGGEVGHRDAMFTSLG
jgi:hypothetical protein